MWGMYDIRYLDVTHALHIRYILPRATAPGSKKFFARGARVKDSFLAAWLTCAPRLEAFPPPPAAAAGEPAPSLRSVLRARKRHQVSFAGDIRLFCGQYRAPLRVI